MTQTPQAKIRRSHDDWERLMAEYEAGNVTQREFCERQKLSCSTFSCWRKRLRQTAPSNAQTEPLFELPIMPVSSGQAWRLEIDLGQGVMLRLK